MSKDAEPTDGAVWYVMRDLKRPNSLDPAYKMLARMGFETFTPTKDVVTVRAGRRIKVERPIISDLLFVHTLKSLLDPVVGRTDTLQYRYVKGAPYCTPMTVGDKEMSDFIAATKATSGMRLYAPEEISPTMIGKKISIVGGPFDTLSGNLLTIKGSRKKRLLVSLPGIAAVSVEVAPEFIRICE